LQLDIQQVSRNSTAEINRLQSAAASASLRLAQVSLTKTAVTSPISGFINKVYVEAGEYINPGAHNCRSGTNQPSESQCRCARKRYRQGQIGKSGQCQF
jgi:multidrug efflux pump subunit AcrA (membrane-fusion protein)